MNDTCTIIRSHRSSIFTVDYIPERYRHSLNTTQDAVHFCVVAGRPGVAEVNILVNFILLHSRQSDIVSHLILHESSKNTVPLIFTSINCIFSNVINEFAYADLT